MLVVHPLPERETIADHVVRDLPDLLAPGDVLVLLAAVAVQDAHFHELLHGQALSKKAGPEGPALVSSADFP